MQIKIRKNIICARKIIFGILLYVVAKLVNVWEVLLTMKFSEEIIDMIKTIPTKSTSTKAATTNLQQIY